MLSKQRKYADWVAAWRNGMRNANKWAVERESRQQGGVNSYSGQITQHQKDLDHERDGSLRTCNAKPYQNDDS